MKSSLLGLLLWPGVAVLAAPDTPPQFAFPRTGDARFAYQADTLRPNLTTPAQGAGTPLDLNKLNQSVVDFYNLWRAQFLVTLVHDDATLPAVEVGKPQAFINVNAYDLDREMKPQELIRTVSEAHGYGMLIAVLMAGHPRPAGVSATRERTDFDNLYRFYKAHPSVPDPDAPNDRHQFLMAFQLQGANVRAITEAKLDDEKDSASDADMDIAYALLLASRQWDNSTGINYLQAARDIIGQIEAFDLNPKAHTVKLGDAIVEGKTAKEIAKSKFYGTRTSDFMIQHWRAFAQVGDAALWNAVIAKTLAIETNVFANFAPHTGLMPDFMELPNSKPIYFESADSATAIGLYRPVGPKFLESKYDGEWSYNACRTPWRLATDYLINGARDTLGQLEVLNSWSAREATDKLFVKSGAKKVATRLLKIDGLPHPEGLTAGYSLAGARLKAGKDYDPASSCFLAPLAVSAMLPPASNQDWLNRLWTTLTSNGAAIDEPYYDSAVKLLCMITISGNWWDPSRFPLP